MIMRDAAPSFTFPSITYNTYVPPLLFKEDLWIERREPLKNSRGHARHKMVGTLISHAPRFRKDWYLGNLIAWTIVKFLPYH